ncbi:unnamed protein product [Chironomus riparius]|uniref:Tyrosinase copper-binding domain-containing protein n=1 Tax=Chironomus riparius TaxID=315576 RepID=A0A9N9S6U0_9DIPT|nr:unnamed protein product [Chironomus riparius]
MADKKNLLLLFENPSEPVFTPKGKQNAVFQVPDKFLEDKYQNIGSDIQSRFGEEAEVTIPVRDAGIPNIKVASELDKQDNFSLFIPRHRKLASALTDVFLKARDIDQLQSYAVYARDRVNGQLFNYALSVALLHRPDTKDLNLPLFVESFPSKFIDSRSFGRAREEANVVQPGSRRPIVIPRDYTASDLEPEHRLWYFREDLGINLHHWHWHLVYPFESSDINIVRKDRRGELFYYMHEQIVARYNFERLCNNLPRTAPLSDFRAFIPEGYFPKLDSLIASRSWPARQTNAVLQNLNRTLDQVVLQITDLERWRERFMDAVNQMAYVDARGQRRALEEQTGIDVLGDMMEASLLTPNSNYYGDLHNMGHVIISYQHDPDHRHLESFGVMGDSATAMRDPIFYRWHQAIDDMFNEYKIRLPPYTVQQLSYPGITVASVGVQLENGRNNQFHTFWQQSDINLSKGMDFVPRGDVFARFTHLQHIPYNLTIQVNNDSGAPKLGMVRVFMAPLADERNQQMLFRDLRRNMIELDKFVANLRPGQNTLRRRSVESTVTIPYERTFRNLDTRPTGGQGEQQFNFCGCGWPHHMLIPKGTTQGIRAQLFVMVSNYEQDRVNQDLGGTCSDAASYCGIRDRLYPDRRHMGYPFDRINRQGADALASFLTPNMRVQDVMIIHNDRVSGPTGQ